jgi:hypothetical protein
MEATVNQMMQINSQWTRKLTPMLTMSSGKTAVVRIDGETMNSGQSSKKGMARLRRLRAPFVDSFHPENQRALALLLDHTTGPGVVGILESLLDSGDRCWLMMIVVKI